MCDFPVCSYLQFFQIGRCTQLVTAAAQLPVGQPDALAEYAHRLLDGARTTHLGSAHPVGVGTYTGSHQLVAVMSVQGRNISGTLGIAATAAAASVTHPVSGFMDGATPGELQSWLGELANRLLGHVKCQLATAEIEIWLSTPVTFSASEFSVEGDRHRAVLTYAVGKGSDRLGLWLDLEGLTAEALANVQFEAA